MWWVIAQVEGPPAEPSLSYFLQFGVIGFGLVALIMGWIVPRYVLARQRDDHAEQMARLISDKDAQLARAWDAQAKAEAQRDHLLEALQARYRQGAEDPPTPRWG